MIHVALSDGVTALRIELAVRTPITSERTGRAREDDDWTGRLCSASDVDLTQHSLIVSRQAPKQ
jgi:hypothetical protein